MDEIHKLNEELKEVLAKINKSIELAEEAKSKLEALIK